MRTKWQQLGYPAHFCGGNECRFHISTKIGKWIVSTVGDYRPYEKIPTDKFEKLSGDMRANALLNSKWKNKKQDDIESIGVDRFYETMVFRAKKAKCGCCQWAIEVGKEHPNSFGGYNTAMEATKGHNRICSKIDKEVDSGK